MSYAIKHLYEFGPFRFDLTERVLFRDDQPLNLTPKATDLLLALVERRGRLVEKEELIGIVWPETTVEESNLTHHISVLRKTLGENENGQKFIETIPRRGYRFVGEVKEINGVIVQSEIAAIPHLVETLRATPDTQPQTNRRIRVVAFVGLATLFVFLGIGSWQYARLKKTTQVEQIEFKGDFYHTRFTEGHSRKAIDQWMQAIALEPDSASAYAGLSETWMFLSDAFISPREAMPQAQAAAVKALRLDPNLAEAHIAMGWVKLRYEWNWAAAEQEYRQAIALDPKEDAARLLHAFSLNAQGRFDEAQGEMQRASESHPLDQANLWGLGLSFHLAGQYEPAIEQFRRAIGVEPMSPWAHLPLGWAYEQQGKFAEAIAEFRLASQINDSSQVLGALGHVYAVSGQRDEAQKITAELQDAAKRKYVSPYDIAIIYAGLGDKEQALIWLEKAYEDRSGTLAFFLNVDPRFNGLRSDSRFLNLLRRIGSPEKTLP